MALFRIKIPPVTSYALVRTSLCPLPLATAHSHRTYAQPNGTRQFASIKTTTRREPVWYILYNVIPPYSLRVPPPTLGCKYVHIRRRTLDHFHSNRSESLLRPYFHYQFLASSRHTLRIVFFYFFFFSFSSSRSTTARQCFFLSSRITSADSLTQMYASSRIHKYTTRCSCAERSSTLAGASPPLSHSS